MAPLPRRLRGPEEVLAAFTAAVPAGAVLVPHSNAGLYAPALAAAGDATATVYVDAALPSAEPTSPLAPPGLLEHLAGLVDDEGLLPPWTRWWDEADLAGLFPDAAWRARVEQEQPRLPWAYFTSRVPVPAGWTARPSAYLAFGGTYAEEAARAREEGWPVDVLDGGHLHLLHDPDAVAASIVTLLAGLAGR